MAGNSAERTIVEGKKVLASFGDEDQVAELRVQKTHSNKYDLITSLYERAGAYRVMFNFAGFAAVVSFFEGAIALAEGKPAGMAAAGVSLAADVASAVYFSKRSSDTSLNAMEIRMTDRLPVVLTSSNRK